MNKKLIKHNELRNTENDLNNMISYKDIKNIQVNTKQLILLQICNNVYLFYK